MPTDRAEVEPLTQQERDDWQRMDRRMLGDAEYKRAMTTRYEATVRALEARLAALDASEDTAQWDARDASDAGDAAEQRVRDLEAALWEARWLLRRSIHIDGTMGDPTEPHADEWWERRRTFLRDVEGADDD